MRVKLKLLFHTLWLSFAALWLGLEGWTFYGFITKPIANSEQSAVITIPPGASSGQVANILYQAQMIRHPTWFKWWLRYHEQDDKLQAGEFEIHPYWTLNELMAHLVSGQTVHYPVTFTPGETLQEAIKKVHHLPKLVGSVNSAIFSQALKEPSWQALEGYLLPETYHYQAGEKRLNILLRAHKMMQSTLDELWPTCQKDLPIKSIQELVILASVVEKETGVAAERPLIAGVFMNRLRQKMRLQSDPTVIYGMGASYKGNITKKDLRTKTPYNTYRIKGLPPTPIALPSKAALEAVCQPAKTSALYFVAKGKTGEHYFSQTLEEHNRAVRKYQLNK